MASRLRQDGSTFRFSSEKVDARGLSGSIYRHGALPIPYAPSAKALAHKVSLATLMSHPRRTNNLRLVKASLNVRSDAEVIALYNMAVGGVLADLAATMEMRNLDY